MFEPGRDVDPPVEVIYTDLDGREFPALLRTWHRSPRGDGWMGRVTFADRWGLPADRVVPEADFRRLK